MENHAEQPTALSPTKRALLALKEMQAKLDAIEQARTEPVAIVGMACRFPGASNLAAYWQMLCEGRSGIADVPPERWDIDALFSPEAVVPGKIRSRHGGFIEALDQFDARFFGISPREAPHVDPRQRLILEVAWEALEDAGIPPDGLAGSQTEVYVATLTADYDNLLTRDISNIQAYTGPGTANSIVANRLSYFLDLRGPSMAVDTACSGSLVALHLACHSLRNQEATMALAGGVSVNLLPHGDLFFSQAGALSPDGQCRTFDARANGIVRGEGVGMLVLKTLSRALADGDRIYALIGGSAVNHDGRSNGIMAPNIHAQEAVYRAAYAQAGIAPAQVQFVETHGTGTPLGDPIEVQSLSSVLGMDRPANFPCLLGSVKTNIGHTEAVAGIAGLIKVALALKHRVIPPNLNFDTLNPLIPLPHFPLHMPRTLSRWPVETAPLIAGVSSFAFGGTNAHLVLKEAPPDVTVRVAEPPAYCVPLSAKSPEALRALARDYQQWMQQADAGVTLRDVAYTASVRRTHHDHRLALVARHRDELTAGLQAVTQGEAHASVLRALGPKPEDDVKRLVFVFSGQGTHWYGMGCELLHQSPVFRQTMDMCDRLLQRYVSWSLLEELSRDAVASRLDETDIAQPAIFAIQVALAALWQSWGICPDAVVGQSLGEVAAAHVAGALSLADAVQVVYHRSRLMKTVAGAGQVAVVGLSQTQVEEMLIGYETELAVAGSSSPTTSVVAGTSAAMARFLHKLEGLQVFHRLLDKVDIAFHSPQMVPLQGDLVHALQGIHPRPVTTPLISTVTGASLEGYAMDAAYWGRNLTDPFRLAQAVQQLVEDRYDTFLEISPHAALSGAIRQNLAHLDRHGVVLSSLQRGEAEWPAMLHALGALYAQGHTVSWQALYPEGGRCISLPAYPWQRETFWLRDVAKSDAAQALARVRKAKSGTHPLLGDHVQSALPSGPLLWEIDLGIATLQSLTDHRVLGSVMFPGAAYTELALAAVAQAFEDRFPVLEAITFDRALRFSESEIRRVQLLLSPTATGEASYQLSSRMMEEAGPVGPWTLHASGKVRYAAGNLAATAAPSVSVHDLRARCPESIAVAEHYEVMQARGLAYGPCFQAVSALWRGENEALSRVVLPSMLSTEAAAYHIHPALLDAGFQVVGAALPVSPEAHSHDVYLPQGIERLQVYGAPAWELWCHVRLRPGCEPGGAVIEADVVFFDESGGVVIEVSGLRLQRFEVAQQRRQREPSEWLYEVDWQLRDFVVSDGRPVAWPTGDWLVFADRSGVGKALAAGLEAQGARCLLVYPSEDDHFVSSQDECRLNPAKAEHFQRLFAHVGARACRGVVHLWGLETAPPDDLGPQALERAEVLGCETALHIVRALTQRPMVPAPRLWLVTQRAQAVGERAACVSVGQATLWGFGRVLSLELPDLYGGLVDLDIGSPEREAELLLSDIRHVSEADQVAYRSGRRYVARLRHLPAPERALAPVRFRVDGTYLITGGLSGLGLLVARWMVQHGARRLILIGRTDLPPRSTWGAVDATHPAAECLAAIRALEAMGAHVHAASMDIADAAQLSAWLTQYHQEGWPPVRGVVHAAGLVQDQLLMQMDTGTLQQVMRPKVHGAWALHGATAHLPLDFFVLFSSMTAVLGQFGQANYAAGNAFMDALAHYRRAQGLVASSINWGPWSEIGMFARLQAAGAREVAGIETLDPEQGLQVLMHVLSRHPAQAGVMAADWRQLHRSPLLADLLGESDTAADSESIAGDNTVLLELLLTASADRQTLLESKLCEVIAHVFRVSPDHLDTAKPLISLGMDSLMAVELKNAVEGILNLDVSMVDLFTGSISQLAERMMAQLQESDGLADLLDQVEGLSMAEVDELLAQDDA